jgi:acyl-coenzyme A synthetase/AMP-(fatty) acid ligase
VEVIEDLSNVEPERTAIVLGEDRIDYARFASDVADLSAWLVGQGLSSKQSVGIFLNQPYWSWVAHLATLRLGLTVATLTTRFAEEAAAAGGLDVWLGETSSDFERPVVERTVLFSPQSMSPLAQQFNVSKDKPNKQAPQLKALAKRLMFTSGTTGKPKAVLWDAPILERRIELARNSQGLNANSVLTSMLGMDTTGGFRYPLAIWKAGGCVLLRSPVPGTDRTRLTQKQLSTTNLIVTSPIRLQETLKSFGKPLEGRDTRKIIVAGGRLSLSVRDAALKLACRNISIAYGSTETGSIASGDARLLDRHPGAIGFALEGASVQIVDSDGNPSPAGKAGIVRTRTSYMVHSYLGLAAGSSNSPFRDGWFYPGDEGVLFADGLLAITGRLSETLNLMGLKVSTLDLETKLAQLPSVKEICAVMIKIGRVDVLAFAAACHDDVNMRGLWKQIRVQIPAGVPIRVVRVTTLPRNAMGKIARLALANRLSQYFANIEADLTIE